MKISSTGFSCMNTRMPNQSCNGIVAGIWSSWFTYPMPIVMCHDSLSSSESRNPECCSDGIPGPWSSSKNRLIRFSATTTKAFRDSKQLKLLLGIPRFRWNHLRIRNRLFQTVPPNTRRVDSCTSVQSQIPIYRNFTTLFKVLWAFSLVFRSQTCHHQRIGGDDLSAKLSAYKTSKAANLSYKIPTFKIVENFTTFMYQFVRSCFWRIWKQGYTILRHLRTAQYSNDSDAVLLITHN